MILPGTFTVVFHMKQYCSTILGWETARNVHPTTEMASIYAVVLIKNHGRMAF